MANFFLCRVLNADETLVKAYARKPLSGVQVQQWLAVEGQLSDVGDKLIMQVQDDDTSLPANWPVAQAPIPPV